MKKSIIVVTLGALALLWAAPSNAQVTNSNATAQVTLNVTFSLAAILDNGSRAHVGNKDIVRAISTDLGTPTSRGTILVVASSGGAPSFAIALDKNAPVALDPGVLSVTPAPAPVGAVDVTVSRGKGTTDTSIQVFHLATSTLSFDAQGLTTVQSNGFVNKGNDFGTVPTNVKASIAGSGSGTGGSNSNAVSAVVSGTVSATGRRVTNF
jgi:hypothetical protein